MRNVAATLVALLLVIVAACSTPTAPKDDCPAPPDSTPPVIPIPLPPPHPHTK